MVVNRDGHHTIPGRCGLTTRAFLVQVSSFGTARPGHQDKVGVSHRPELGGAREQDAPPVLRGETDDS